MPETRFAQTCPFWRIPGPERISRASSIHLLDTLGEGSKDQRLRVLLLEVLGEVELASTDMSPFDVRAFVTVVGKSWHHYSDNSQGRLKARWLGNNQPLVERSQSFQASKHYSS